MRERNTVTSDNGPGRPPVVLGFFAHPDDETLSAGGLLALLSQGAQVHVVTATRGEMGEVVAPQGERTDPDREELPLVRAAEVQRACRELGVASHRFLDGGTGEYTDSGMAWEDSRRIRAIPDPLAPADAFSLIDIEGPARALATLIVELRPALIITEEPAGGYGHPDHIRCHDVTMLAARMAASPEFSEDPWTVPFVTFSVQEETRTRAAMAALARTRGVPTHDAYGLPLRRPDLQAPLRTGVARAVDAVVDTSGVTAQVARAMAAHETQVHQVTHRPGADSDGWYALTNNDLKPILNHGALTLAPGWGSAEGLADLLGAAGLPVQPPAPGGRAYAAFLYLFAMFSGIIAGFAGSFTHRSIPPWGLLIALVAVAAGSVLNRTVGSIRTAYTYAAGVIASVLLIATVRTGGDVIIAQDAVGLGWAVGVFISVFVGTLMGGGVLRTAATDRGGG